MKKFVTKFQAVDQTDKKLKWFLSDLYIMATNWESAEIFVKLFYPHLTIVGEFVAEIDFNTMTSSNNNFYN